MSGSVQAVSAETRVPLFFRFILRFFFHLVLSSLLFSSLDPKLFFLGCCSSVLHRGSPNGVLREETQVQAARSALSSGLPLPGGHPAATAAVRSFTADFTCCVCQRAGIRGRVVDTSISHDDVSSTSWSASALPWRESEERVCAACPSGKKSWLRVFFSLSCFCSAENKQCQILRDLRTRSAVSSTHTSIFAVRVHPYILCFHSLLFHLCFSHLSVLRPRSRWLGFFFCGITPAPPISLPVERPAGSGKGPGGQPASRLGSLNLPSHHRVGEPVLKFHRMSPGFVLQ